MEENKGIEIIPLYPTLIYHSDMEGHHEYANTVLSKECLDTHGFNFETDIPNQSERTTGSASGEYRGKVLLHQDARYDSFFREITAHVSVYLEGTFMVRRELLDIHIMKSWYSILPPHQELSFHRHSCSDISFVYYPHVDENTYPLWFANFERTINNNNEVFPGLFQSNSDGKQYLKEYNQFTSPMNSVIPHSGSVLIFPSNIMHGVFPLQNQIANDTRITIAGDIKLSLRQDILNYESGLIHPKHWRKF